MTDDTPMEPDHRASVTQHNVPKWCTSWPEWFGIFGNVTVVPLDDYQQLERELAEARKDAERYHKLIGMLFEYSLHFRSAGPKMQLCNNSFVLGEGAGADAAIDAARREHGQG